MITGTRDKKQRFTQRLEEDRVAALVEGEKVLANGWKAVEDLQDLCSLYHLGKHEKDKPH